MRFVALAGIDGCGKTSQAKALRSHLASNGLKVGVTEVWDILADPSLNTGFMGGAAELRAYLESLSSTARCLFIFHALFEATQRAKKQDLDLLLAVGYTSKYGTVESLLGTPPSIIQELEAALPPPDFTLWLDLDPKTAGERKQTFTRYECGGKEVSPQNFELFQTRCREVLLLRAQAQRWHRIDASGDEEAVTERLLKAWESAS